MKRTEEVSSHRKLLKVHPEVQIDSLVKTLLNRCKKEKHWRHLHVPLKDIEVRVAGYTGLPVSYVYQCAEHNKDDFSALNNDHPLENQDHIAIMVCLRDIYKQKGLPKIQNLYEAVHASRSQNHQKYTISYEQFSYEVSMLGYRYRPLINGDCMIMEEPKLSFDRYNFLKKLKEIRMTNVNIYYLDERIVGRNMNNKNSTEESGDNNEKVLFVTVWRHGSVKDIFLKSVLSDYYFKWLTETLLPMLPPSSVIIISSHHGQFKNVTITKYHSKKDMLTWLREHNIPCCDEMHKAELYELIDKLSLKSAKSTVENILKANGYTVLILPSSLQTFTPTALLWSDMTKFLKNNSTKETEVKICNHIKSVKEEQRLLYENTIVDLENLISDIDSDVDNALEYYKLDTAYSTKLSFSDEYDVVE